MDVGPEPGTDVRLPLFFCFFANQSRWHSFRLLGRIPKQIRGFQKMGHVYTPILPTKVGELQAVLGLKNESKSRIVPLFELPPVDWDFEADAPSKSIDDHVGGIVDKLCASWNRRAYLDLFYADPENLADGTHVVTSVFSEIASQEREILPVVGIGRSPAYSDAVRPFANRFGVCLRLLEDNFRAENILRREIESLLSQLDISETSVDLLLDLGMGNRELEAEATFVDDYFDRLARIFTPRSVILSKGTFPQNLGDLPRNSVSRITRADWQLWNRCRRQRPNLIYSDFCIRAPSLDQIDFRYMRRNAAIRYTHDSEYIVVKGIPIARGQAAQTPGLARTLIGLPEYCGANFSWGDEYIEQCANGLDGPGSATTWRAVGTNHHIEFVLSQLP